MAINNFIVLFVFLVASGLGLLALMYVENLLSPKIKPTGMGRALVESAERPFAGSRLVGFQYYLYAIVFVIIEALLVFLFLWGQNAIPLGAMIFVGVGVALVYMILLVRYVIDPANEVM